MPWVLLLGLVFLGCGQTREDASSQGAGGTGGVAGDSMGGVAAGGAAADGTGGVATGGTGGLFGSGGDSGGPPGCVPSGDGELRGVVPACGEGCRGAATFVVRLDYQTLEIIGWHFAAGTVRHVDEETARQTAVAATGFGTESDELQLESFDLYVFYRWPGDFGGIAMASALFDEPLFGGEIVWSGRGSITYPLDWEPAATLGMGCGFDEGMLPSDEAEREVVERVGETALPQAFLSGPQGITVYEYTPTVGDTDYSVAEWLVFVTGYGPAGV